MPHRLYGRIDAAENYSVGRWRTEAAATIDTTKRYGRAAIVVGGTGLYFNALMRGLAAVPPIPDEIREEVRARLESEGINKLHTELMQRDPAAAARLMPGDRARITRALEVVLATGRSLLQWHEEGNAASLDAARAAKIFLSPDRDALMRRIDTRFDEMVTSGAIEEVQALAARGLDPNLPAMKAHGVPWLIRHLHGEISLEEAAEGAKRDTRQYTKRQATWFRNQLPEFAWVEPEKALAAVEEQLRGLAKCVCGQCATSPMLDPTLPRTCEHRVPRRGQTRRPRPRPALMRHVLQAGRVGGATDHAGNADLDLAGGGGDDAAHR